MSAYPDVMDTLVSLAKRRGFSEMVAILEKAGAR